MTASLPETVEAQLLEIQAAVTGLRTAVSAGSAASIGAASAALAQLADTAAGDGDLLRRYLGELGVRSLPEASRVLRAQGHTEQAARVQRVRLLAASITHQQASLAAFVRECLDVLDVTRDRVAQREPHGRLLGSA